jgi:hypothetical protein
MCVNMSHLKMTLILFFTNEFFSNCLHLYITIHTVSRCRRRRHQKQFRKNYLIFFPTPALNWLHFIQLRKKNLFCYER